MTGRLWGAVALAALVLISGVTHWWVVHKRDVRITELEAVIAKRDGELIQAGQVESVLRDAIQRYGRQTLEAADADEQADAQARARVEAVERRRDELQRQDSEIGSSTDEMNQWLAHLF